MKKIVFFYKLFIVLGCVFGALILIFPAVAFLMNVEFDIVMTIWTIILFSCFAFGTAVLLFPFIFENLDISSGEDLSPEKFIIEPGEPSFFLNTAESSLQLNNFSKLYNQSFESFEIDLYYRKRIGGNLYLVSLLKTDELTDQMLEQANDAITACVENYYNKKMKNIYHHITVISLFCVRRITKTFRKIVNTEVEQGLKNGRFIAGISFGGNKLYIAKQNSFLDLSGYKKYRKLFFKIFGYLIKG